MRFTMACSIAGLLLNPLGARDARAQRTEFGAMAIGAATSADPAVGGRRLTEGYLTQPALLGSATLVAGRAGTLRATGTLNIEGYTLARGELNAGMYGEGYIDRRHPHTLVHEAMLTATSGEARRWRASLAVGKGFVPFGTDDPMMRPFIKYPVNHHHAQIIERVQAVGAVRWQRGTRWLALEQGWFNGDEPTGPFTGPQWSRVGDSHATRVTVSPSEGWEWQGSRAFVRSPGLVQGGAFDHRQLSSAVRYASRRPRGVRYALAEIARTDESIGTRRVFRFTSALVESQLAWKAWRLALRAERTDRPELERLLDLFRTNRGHVDFQIIGITRWSIGTAQVAAPARTLPRLRMARVVPFLELSRAAARARLTPAVFEPAAFYGAAAQWSITAGVRLHAGVMRARMGRYGVLAPPASAHEAHDDTMLHHPE